MATKDGPHLGSGMTRGSLAKVVTHGAAADHLLSPVGWSAVALFVSDLRLTPTQGVPWEKVEVVSR